MLIPKTYSSIAIIELGRSSDIGIVFKRSLNIMNNVRGSHS